METVSHDLFYNNLPFYGVPISELLNKPELLTRVPCSWHVVLTDVRGSTQIVLEGKHELVNLIATGSIVTVLNIASSLGINIPFFFGGDGATFIVPDSIIDQIMESLTGYREHTLNNFGIDLRTGMVPVTELYRHGQEIRIAKASNSERFVIPVVLGEGLGYAEQLIKSAPSQANNSHFTSLPPDLSGMQCRWDRIAPPDEQSEVVTLLVSSRDARSQALVFAEVLYKIEYLYGTFSVRQPISVQELKLRSTFKQLKMQDKSIRQDKRLTSFFHTWFNTLYYRFFFRTIQGMAYLQRLVEMSDTLVIDGRINTVISGTATQRKELFKFLEQLEQNGSIIYGSHISSASVMSCYVRDLEYGHIHFVDGAEGGYTQAATIFKRKLNTFGTGLHS